VLEETGDETRAIQACIHAADRSRQAAEPSGVDKNSLMAQAPKRALAEGEQARIRERIREASRQAQERMNELDAEQLAELRRVYEAAAADLAEQIRAHGDKDSTLRLEVLQDLRQQLTTRLDELAEERDQLLEAGLTQAAQTGAEPWVAVAGTATPKVAEEAVRFVRELTAADGLQLSDRLWRIDQAAKEEVARAIENAVAQGQSASQAATDFLDRGEAVPDEVQARLDMAKTGRAAAEVEDALMKAPGNPRYQAERLFRTEMNRAHGEAYMAGAEDHPDFQGFRFELSPAHPRPDECDMHARANLFGLGPGVYPSRSACPWPAHPNTLSYVTVVFPDEISDADRQQATDRISWLKDQPADRQEQILGSAKKREALERGLLDEDDIQTPWHILRERYAQRGIDI
jgi:hypothetical protein